MEEARRECEVLRRQAAAKGDADRNLITDLQLENSKIKFQFENLSENFEDEMNQLKSTCAHEIKSRQDSEIEHERTRKDMIINEEKVCLYKGTRCIIV